MQRIIQQELYLLQCKSLQLRFILIKFCIFGDFVPRGFYLLFMWSNTVNTQYRANLVSVRFCPWEDFIPHRVQSFDLSLHYCKHSTISSFVFFNFFCSGGFCRNNNSTIYYVHHYGKHTYSFVFW